MVIRCGVFSAKSTKALKAGWLITAGVVVLYLGVIQPRERVRGIASQRATGLAAVSGSVGWEPLSLWRQTSLLPHSRREAYLQKGVVGGVPSDRVAVVPASLATFSGGASDKQESASEDRKLAKTAGLDLLVKAPGESTEKIVQIAQSAGGFLASSNVNGGTDATSAFLSIRVPTPKFDEVHAAIHKLGLRVENESIEAQDVTRQYVDDGARLRILRAQEQQYFEILRKAATVKDTLEVSQKLDEVRGTIEEKQAEFETLSKQVENVAININLHSEADARVFGLNWRPLYQLKVAAREGLEGLGDYAVSMTAFVFYLPTILLWLFTVLFGAAVGWRILKWAARSVFTSPKTGLVEKTAG
jgi:hypothetical protein